MAHNSQLFHKLNKRLKLAASLLLIFVVTGAGTVLALTIEHRLTQPTVVVEQKTTSQPSSSPTTTTAPTNDTTPTKSTTTTTPAPVATTPAPTATPTPTPAAKPVVAPSPSGEVPTLQPTSTSTTTSTGSGSTSTTAPVKTASSYKSTNWSGYMASGGTFTAVSGSWVVPSAISTSTTANSYDAAWIGIGGVTSSDLIQTGTANVVSPSGVISTMAFYELLPAAAQNVVSMTVTVGDVMSASISQTATSQWSLTITDVTTGKSFSKSLAYTSQLSSAEWIEEDPTLSDGSLAPLNNFGTVNFSGGLTTMNGSSVSIADSGAASITMVDKNGASIAVPSAVSSGMFSVTYQ